MFSKKTTEIEMQSKLLLQKNQIHLGKSGDWVHAVFDNQAHAELTSKEFKSKALVDNAPIVRKSTKDQTYGEGKFYFRIHPTAYENIADKYGLPSIAELTTAAQTPARRAK
jgi:hypothetical protein